MGPLVNTLHTQQFPGTFHLKMEATEIWEYNECIVWQWNSTFLLL